MKRKTPCQKIFRKKKFPYNQYWSLAYTESYKDGTEKDFKSFIKARSYFLAKELLKMKIKEDNPSVKIKSLQGLMFHSELRIKQKKLTIQDWENIRNSSFPNNANYLFKIEIPRPPDYDHRLGKVKTLHLKSIGFKSGEENWSVKNVKGKVLPESERSHKIYNGKWIDWEPQLRNAQLDKIVGAMLRNGNCKTKAAKDLKISRNKLYKLMKKFPEIDWENDYSIKAFNNYVKE